MCSKHSEGCLVGMRTHRQSAVRSLWQRLVLLEPRARRRRVLIATGSGHPVSCSHARSHRVHKASRYGERVALVRANASPIGPVKLRRTTSRHLYVKSERSLRARLAARGTNILNLIYHSVNPSMRAFSSCAGSRTPCARAWCARPWRSSAVAPASLAATKQRCDPLTDTLLC